MDFQDLLVQNGDFGGQNKARGGTILTPQRTRSYFWGLLPLYHFRRKSIKKCDHESAHRQTHRWTHAQRQTEFIICPMLDAIDMRQITRLMVNYCALITGWPLSKPQFSQLGQMSNSS